MASWVSPMARVRSTYCKCGNPTRQGTSGRSCKQCHAKWMYENYRGSRKRGFFRERARTVNWKRRTCSGKLYARDLMKLWREQRGRCALTGERLTRRYCTLDHIIPCSRGGINDISNARWVAPGINFSKRDKLDSEAQIGNYGLPLDVNHSQSLIQSAPYEDFPF